MIPGKIRSAYTSFFKARGWKAFPYQVQLLEKYFNGLNGILNAPTGSGKTLSLWLPSLLYSLHSSPKKKGVKVIWVTPVRALATDIRRAMQESADYFECGWKVGSRTGDTTLAERKKQKDKPPDCLITTPESLHLLLSNKDNREYFGSVECIVVDEWHELLGSKRGVQTELAVSRIRSISPSLRLWGISATIGNLDQAAYVLLGEDIHELPYEIVKADVKKKITMTSVIPEKVEEYPWAGHLGVKLIDQVLDIIQKSGTTLIFTNTRSQCEIWYQRLLITCPDLAGQLALHHGSLSPDVRTWVEKSLHEGKLKAVVCTSSLDLGVDISPVETVVQIGGPKGVARFLQRAGRSGHQPGAESKIFFVPAHSLELVEASALRTAIKENKTEERRPVIRCFDVLIQYLVTLAVGGGFDEREVFSQVIKTHAFNTISDDEWSQMLVFITSGGASLRNYPEYSKVVVNNGLHVVADRRTAMRHRLSIGTIVSDPMMQVKLMTGKRLGTIEESFISRLNPGNVFSFAGRSLELVKIQNMEVLTRISKSNKTIIPQWLGGKMPLSGKLSQALRERLDDVNKGIFPDREMESLKSLFKKQQEQSVIPSINQFLIECIETKEGFHYFFFTFEGRYVNEGIAAVLSYRLTREKSRTFSIGLNDYCIDLLTDEPIDIEKHISQELFTTKNLEQDILGGMNSAEMARRKFRDIANIAGLVFTGYPGKQKPNKHLQASSRLFFEVFNDYEPDNLLLKQAYEEVLFDQLDEIRMREALNRINQQEIVIKHPEKLTPFSFPVYAEMFRDKAGNEKIEEKLQKIINQL